MEKHEFPQTVYVKIETDEEDSFLIAAAKPDGLVDDEEEVLAAEYRLARVVVIQKRTAVVVL